MINTKTYFFRDVLVALGLDSIVVIATYSTYFE